MADVIALSRLTQHTLAEFIACCYLDRHLGRARSKRHRELVCATLPEARGRPAWLFVSLPPPGGVDESVVLADAAGAASRSTASTSTRCVNNRLES